MQCNNAVFGALENEVQILFHYVCLHFGHHLSTFVQFLAIYIIKLILWSNSCWCEVIFKSMHTLHNLEQQLLLN